jgi:RHS repeat-associated protein
VNTYTYAAFGGDSPANTETVANSFHFTGREYDPETKLYYYRARYYDPLWGRFLSEDPIGMNGGGNVYRFAVNDPTSVRDQSGMWPVSLSATTSNLGDLIDFLRGTGGAGISHVEDAAARELSDTPGMKDIRRQYRDKRCEGSGLFCSDFQYREFVTTDNLTGQLVGSFCVRFTPIARGRVLVDAQNTMGLESATRLPQVGNLSNRNNPSIQEMIVNDAPLTYPRSVLSDRSSGPMKNLTVHYLWVEKSPCCGK